MPTPTYIHSGVNRPDLLSLLAQEQAAGMVNAHVVREPRLQWAFERYSCVPLYLDSGFRRKMEVSSYVRLIETYGERFIWIANLDAVFDQQTSNRHYRDIVSRLSSASLRSKVLWIYQGGDLAEFAAVARDLQLVGIGGCVLRMMRDGVDTTLHWLLRLGDVLDRVGARAHIFGVGNKTMLTRLGALPSVASIDSSKWLVAYRAHMRLLPSGKCVQALECSRRECAAKNIHVIEGWMQPCALDASLTQKGPFL